MAPECVALPPMAAMPTMDARIMSEGLHHRSEHHDKRQNFAPNQYVELII